MVCVTFDYPLAQILGSWYLEHLEKQLFVENVKSKMIGHNQGFCKERFSKNKHVFIEYRLDFKPSNSCKMEKSLNG